MVLHVTVGQPRGTVRRGGGQHLLGGALAEEGVHLADAALDGQGRIVGKPRLERAPDALDRVVVGAVAGAVQHQQAGMGLQPALDDLGAVDDDVVADDRHHRCGRVGGQQMLAERGEGGADGLAGLWGAETRIRTVNRRFVPSADALLALVDRPLAHPPAGSPER
jgi:hypothetical protein